VGFLLLPYCSGGPLPLILSLDVLAPAPVYHTTHKSQLVVWLLATTALLVGGLTLLIMCSITSSDRLSALYGKVRLKRGDAPCLFSRAIASLGDAFSLCVLLCLLDEMVKRLRSG